METKCREEVMKKDSELQDAKAALKEKEEQLTKLIRRLYQLERRSDVPDTETIYTAPKMGTM